VSDATQHGKDDLEGRLRNLVDAHFDSVFRFLARRVGAELARDLTAETFKEAIANLTRYDPAQGTEIAWLFAIAHHVLSHHRRSERRRLRAYARLAGGREIAHDASADLDDRLDAVVIARVGRTLRRLPNEQRDAFVLVAIDGLSYAEATLILGVPDGTVRSRVSRARARLRRSAGLADARASGKPATIRGES
jgi:RNA polymerase sigma-70 factor (ECF subfamily)